MATRRKPDEPTILQQAMAEFEVFAFGEVANLPGALSATDRRSRKKAVVLDKQLMKRLALEGLAVMRFLAARGNERCARYLVDRCLGTPDQPFTDAVAAMTPAEAKNALVQEYVSLGFAEGVAADLAEAVARGETPEIPLEAPLGTGHQ